MFLSRHVTVGNTLINDLNCLLLCFVQKFICKFIYFVYKKGSFISTLRQEPCLRIFVAFSFANPSLGIVLILNIFLMKEQCTEVTQPSTLCFLGRRIIQMSVSLIKLRIRGRRHIREVKLDVYGKRQTAKGKNKPLAVCLQLSVQ